MSSSFVKDCSDASAPASNNGMNSSGVPATGSGAGNKTVFIIVNDSHIDQEQLSSILANHADATSEVSVLQMASGGSGLNSGQDTVAAAPTPGAVAALNAGAPQQQQPFQDSLNTIPIESGEAGGNGYSELALDAESLHQLESVLCTDEARHLLASDNLLDILSAAPNSSGSSDSPAGVASATTSTTSTDVNSAKPAGRGRGRAPPKRRSQRRQDKAEREEVTKILAENQRMLQREREELMASSQTSDSQEHSSQQEDTTDAEEQHSEQEESENDEGRSSDEEQEDTDEDDKEAELKKDQALKNARPVAARVAKTATRGRGRPRRNQSVAASGSGRGRGGPEAETGTRTPGSHRGPRGRGRGRGVARGSKGKHMPVMTEEEQEDDELPELGSPSGAANTSSASREDELDDLEKQLSDLHGGHDEEDEDEVAPSRSSSAGTAGQAAPAAKKIVFLKKGTIGMNKTASSDKKKAAAKTAVQKKNDALAKKESENEKKRNGEKEDESGDDDEDEDEEEEDYDDSGDDDYDPVKESAIMNAVNDAANNKEKFRLASKRNSATSVEEATSKKSPVSPTKKALAKKAKGQSEGSPKKTIQRLIDKKGNVRYVAKKAMQSPKSQNLEKKFVEKPKASPVETNYLKILQLAQKNVDDQIPKKVAKPLPEAKNVLKQMKEIMSENKSKASISGKEYPKDVKEGSSTKSGSPPGKSGNDSRVSDPNLKARNFPKPPGTPIQKPPKLFTAALDVPYETLNKNKIVKKFATGSGIIGGSGSKGRDVAPPPKRKDDTQTYKDANKQLLHKLTSKLGKVSKDVSVTVDFVHNKNTTSNKVVKSPSKPKASPLPSKYKEEFDEEDEELDDMEEYQPVEPVSSENVRRSNRAPKKKSFGDEMIMLDEDPHEELSEDENNEDEDVKDKADSNENDETKHTLKKKKDLVKDEMTTVKVEVVDELPKRSKDEDFKLKEEEDEDEEDEEEASSEDEFVEEDDPERLWCICHRPHNNRFMICCDGCEDWFHGSCVGITKAMGKQMEVDGKEWMCPNCKRAAKAAAQLKVGEVSEKPALDQQVKENPHVLVVNNRTGQVLAGKNAPTLNELSEFLKQNPEYSLVRPWEMNARRASDSSVDKAAQEKQKPGRITINVSKAAAEAGFKEDTPSGASSAPVSGQRKTILLTSVKAPPNVPVAPSSANADDSTQKAQKKQKAETPQPKQVKKRSRSESESSKSEAPPTPSTPAAPPPSAPSIPDIRRNVRKALTDSLLRRCEQNRSEFPDFDKGKIEELVKAIEEELFVYFNKSVNFKYKSRYRSLVFNIRDEKNGGLFRQIVTGAVTPQKLATMTSDEMASKELAEWRQTQGKKELEAIQKHELDMLSLGNTYIMKSHKGEIEIDKDDFIRDKEKARETVKLPEEEPLLEDMTDGKDSGSGTPALASTSSDASKDKSDRHSSSSRHKRSRDSRRESDRDRDRDRDRHRDRDRDRDRDRNRERDRDRDRDRDRERDRDRDRNKDRDRDRERDRDRKHSREDDRESSTRKRSRRDDDDDPHKRRRHSEKDDRRDRDRDRDDRRHRDRDHRDRKRHDSGRHHHDSKNDRRDRKSKNDEVSTSDDKVERRNLSSIDEADEEADAQPSSTVGPLPGESSYDQLPPLPANLPTYLPQEQDELIPSTTPPPMEDDPSYIAPYSPEAIPPQSPIPARNGSEKYLLDSPQTPPLGGSPSSTPPPQDDGEYSPSAPPYSGTPLPAKNRKSKSKRSSVYKFDTPSRGSVDSIAIWRGMVQMTDVAKFSATAFEVSGGSVNFTQDVPESIDIVGRISPDNVWNYIADTKKAASKEILVVRFQPTSEKEKVFYIALYSYLYSKKRYGVVGNCDKTIKDFYIIPLASHQPIPQVLLPLHGPGFEEQRPHMLVGVVVRTKPKRIYDNFSGTWKDLPDPTKLSEESSAMLSELKEASERSFTPPLPGAPYDPEEADEEQDRSDTPDVKKSSASSILELLPDSPVLASPSGAPDDDADSDAEIIEVPPNKAAKRPTEEDIIFSNKKPKTDLSKEQESLLAELNRQIEQHKKELSAMHESINQTKEKKKETRSAVEETSVKSEPTEPSNDDVEKKASDPVKLDTSKISIPDNLHIILEGIKRKEEEIRQKQEEIVRRKNEALSCGAGDTDMRCMLPQPLAFSSTPSSGVQELRADTNTAVPISKAFSGPASLSLPPTVSTMMQAPPSSRLGEVVAAPTRPLQSAMSSFDLTCTPPGMDLRPAHPQLAVPPRPPGIVPNQPVRPSLPRPFLEPNRVPSSPMSQGFPSNPGPQNFPSNPPGPQNFLTNPGPQNFPPNPGPQNYPPNAGPQNFPPNPGPQNFPSNPGPQNFSPHPVRPPPHDISQNMMSSPAPHAGGPPRGPPPLRGVHPGHPPRGFGPPSSHGGPPPHMVRPPPSFNNNDDQFGPRHPPPSHENFQYGNRAGPGYRSLPRDERQYGENSFDDFQGYPSDDGGRRYSEDTPPLEYEGFDPRRGNREWNSPTPWKGRGRGDWERRGRGGRW